MKKIHLLPIAFVLLIGFQSCKSGKKAFQKGNYYLAVIQSCDKLRRSPNNKKAKNALADAYPLAIQTIELNNKNLKSSNSMTKWKTIVRNYKNINHMYEEILRSPAALGIIPNPVDRYSELENANKNAAEESYVFGVENLNKNNRKDAIIAYNAFLECQSYVPNYKDSNKLLDEARRIATILVLVKQDPVPANFAVSGVYFKNKIDEYLHSADARKNFIEFYRPDEVARSGIKPDHVLTLRYQDFSIGNVYQTEHVEHITRDSVVVSYVEGTPGNGTGTGTTGGSRNSDTPETSDDTSSASASDTFGKDSNKDDSGNTGNSGTSEGDGTSGGNTNDNTGNSGDSGNTGSGDNDNKSGNSGDSKNNGPSGSRTKVKVCHNGQTLTISSSALQAHLDHGDSSGPCSTNNSDDKKDKGNNEKKDEPEEDDDKKGGNSNTDDDTTNDNTGSSGEEKHKGNDNSDEDKKTEGDEKGSTNTGNSSGGGSDSGGGGGNEFYSEDGKNKTNKINARASDEGTITGNIPEGSTPIYGTVKATLTTFEKTISSKTLLSMTLTEMTSGRVLKQELFPAEHKWVSRWATFNGDERALSDEQLDLCQQKEQVAPNRDETFNLLSEELYNQVIKNIKRFYINY